MKRFYWLEVISLFNGYLLMINHLEILSIINFISSLIMMSLIIKKIDYVRFSFVSMIVLVIVNALALSGNLDKVYQYFNIIAILISIHLSLLFEILNNENNILATIKPFCFVMIVSLLFFSMCIMMRDFSFFEKNYPNGIYTLFVLLTLMFVPYLSTVTISFLIHEYN